MPGQWRRSPCQQTSAWARSCAMLCAGWHTQQGKEADSPSVGREDRLTGQRDEAAEGATATAKPRLPHDNSSGPVVSSGRGDAGQRGEDEDAQDMGDVLLDPLPGSPGGLATTDLLGNEVPRAAPDVHARYFPVPHTTCCPSQSDDHYKRKQYMRITGVKCMTQIANEHANKVAVCHAGRLMQCLSPRRLTCTWVHHKTPLLLKKLQKRMPTRALEYMASQRPAHVSSGSPIGRS